MSESSDPATPSRGNDTHTPPEPKPSRRKLVQSTLFPCKSPENEANCNGKRGGGEVEDCEDDGEWCGSLKKRKKKQRRKGNTRTMPQSGNSRKEKQGASNGHVGVDSEQCSPIKIEDASPAGFSCQKLNVKFVQATLFPCKSQNFEVDRNDGKKNVGDEDELDEEWGGSQKSGKRKQKKTFQTRTAKKSKERQLNTTPKKSRNSNGHAGVSLGQSSPIVIKEASPPLVPSLRLEAKVMAEETSRIYSGKQIHPFFTSERAGKKIQETSKVENSWSLVDLSDKHANIGPIHIFESSENDDASFDWKDWTFFEETNINSNHYAEGSFSSIFAGSVKVYGFDNLLKSSNTSSLIHSWNKASLNSQVIQKGHSHQSSIVIADENGLLNPLSHNLEVEDGANEVHCFPENAYGYGNPDICHKSMMSYYSSCRRQPADSLWTDKYQPRKAEEVCGNYVSVKLLNEWLHLWHEVDVQNCRTSKDYNERMNDDFGYYTSDCDSEDIYEKTNLKKVLLINGPTGTGKTAAIYACAKEQGFRVLEANASECRNGAVLKHKFGEALQSFWRSCSVKSSVDSEGKSDQKLSFAPHKSTVTDLEEVIEVIPLSDEKDLHIVGSSEETEYEMDKTHCRGELKPLILFEDVDIVFPEDRGFLSAIQEIAETAKGPVILTSSIKNPVVPNNMDWLEVCFKALPPRELLQHALRVCISEKSKIHPHLLEKLIECCDGDIRKTIMCLQYFCCSGKDDQDENPQWLCEPLHFDLVASHQLLPKIFPWNLPSQLSELVEKEISESISRLTKHSSLPDVFDEEITESMEMHKSLTDSIEAKKEAILSRNFSANDCNVLPTYLDNAEELSNSSGTPVAFSRRNARKKIDNIMYSDSDDEFFKGGCPVVSSSDSDDELFQEVDCKVSSSWGATQNFIFPSACENLSKEEIKPDEQHYSNIEAATTILDSNDTSMLFDVSCIPESSFVPETVDEVERISNTVSCGHSMNSKEVSLNTEIKSVSSPAKADSVEQFAPIFHQNSDISRHDFHENLDFSNGDYVEDSHEYAEALPEFLEMNECSRIDFNKKSKFVGRLKPLAMSDLAQESWNSLRNCCPDLRQYVGAEKKDASHMLKLAYGATKLISEADILLLKCHLLCNDSIESPTVISEVSDVLRWCNQQLHMASTFVHHGFACFIEDVAFLGSMEDCQSEKDLSCGISASTTVSMEKVDIVPEYSTACKTSPCGPGVTNSPKSEMHSCLDVIQSIVPSRSYLSVRGVAFHDYLSSLGHISRSEASRLPELSGNMRRGRTWQHYLSTGSLMLTPEDISSLNQCSCYGKTFSQKADANIS